jgi:hypothetical protein
MRVLPLATILLLASTAGPSLAKQDQPNAPAQRTTQSQSQTAPAQGQSQSQPQTVPVQPERTPQQSEQARKDERERAEDGRIRESWKAEERDNDHGDRTGQNRMDRMMGRMDRDDDAMARMMDMCDRMMDMCDRMMERMHHGIRGHDVDRDRNEGYRTGREERDGYAKSYDEEHRASRRVRLCIEDENGDEYCRYRR